MIAFEMINSDQIPDDLAPGKYNTKVISVEHAGTATVIILEWVGTPYTLGSCLFPARKE